MLSLRTSASYIIEQLGCTEAEYRWFVAQAQKWSDLRPGDPTNFLVIPFLIQLVIGVALSLLANLLAPKTSNKPPAQLEVETVDGQRLVQGNRFAAKGRLRYSFQNVVELGSTIPLIFANRIDNLDNTSYGGIRVNANMLWSQVKCPDGSQMLKTIMLIGKGPIEEFALRQFAIGNNLLSGYQLDPSDNTAGRVSIYYCKAGGRIRASDQILGVQADFDIGNAERYGGPDVYSNTFDGRSWAADASYAIKPSTQTTFGIYQPIGNAMKYRLNLKMRHMENPVLTPASRTSSDVRVNCVQDDQIRALRDKQASLFNSYASFSGGEGATRIVNKGDYIDYQISTQTDANHEFRAPNNAEEGSLDAATAIAGRQKQYDDAIIVGELYKIGTASSTCVSRTDQAFNSPADNSPVGGGGNSVSAQFRVVEAGRYITSNRTESPRRTSNVIFGTNRSHAFRCAVAAFTIERPTRLVEFGIRSALGIRFSGICDFRNTKTFEFTDDQACGYIDGKRFSSGIDIKTKNFTSGTFTGSEVRYSFFRIRYRPAGASVDWVEFSELIGTRSNTQQPIYNLVRLLMPEENRWEFSFVPVSGWEVRTDVSSGVLYVLDFREKEITFSGRFRHLRQDERHHCSAQQQYVQAGARRSLQRYQRPWQPC